MKRMRMSTVTVIALLIYVTIMAIYFLPGRQGKYMEEGLIYMIISYLTVFILWFVLRKKEKIKEKKRD